VQRARKRAKTRRIELPAANPPAPLLSDDQSGVGEGGGPGKRRADVYIVGSSLSSPKVCSPSGFDGGARLCCGGEAIVLARCGVVEVVFFLRRRLFLPLIVGDGGKLGWILFL